MIYKQYTDPGHIRAKRVMLNCRVFR